MNASLRPHDDPDRPIWYRKVAVSSTGLAVTVDEVRKRLRIEEQETDADLIPYIRSAQSWWQDATGTTLMLSEVETRYSRFPDYGDPLPLRQAPVVSMLSVTYRDLDGRPTVMSDTAYHADTDVHEGEVFPLDGRWPDTVVGRPYRDTVTLRMVAGYADADAVPEDVKDALYLHVGHRYRFREPASEQRIRMISMGIQHLACRYRRTWLGG